MPSDLHSIDCPCRECRKAENQLMSPNRFLLTWLCLITACLAIWAWIIAPIAVAIFPELAL